MLSTACCAEISKMLISENILDFQGREVCPQASAILGRRLGGLRASLPTNERGFEENLKCRGFEVPRI
jgi:hypothetical protein